MTMNVAAGAFFMYGICAGLIVSKGNFFPASIINDTAFAAAASVPVQLVRTLCALVILCSMLMVLRIFDFETKEKLRSERNKTARFNESLKQKAAELAIANQDLEAFAYSAAHDLRNPLHLILASLDVITPETRSRLGKDDREALGIVGRSVHRMNAIIADLLTLSKISRKELDRQKTDLSGMVRKIVGELEAADPERKVQLDIAPLVFADVDNGAVRIMLENILGNAWKYTSRTPNAYIVFGVKEDRKGAIYYVRDNGAGFAMDKAEKLFNPFCPAPLREGISGNGDRPCHGKTYRRQTWRQDLGGGQGR